MQCEKDSTPTIGNHDKGPTIFVYICFRQFLQMTPSGVALEAVALEVFPRMDFARYVQNVAPMCAPNVTIVMIGHAQIKIALIAFLRCFVQPSRTSTSE